jgi:DNA polymerase-3 subunit delta'
LLKTLEEPPASTTFIVLADQVPPELVTIASRCVRIDFHPIGEAEIAVALVAEGHDPEIARTAAAAAGGNLDRARVLAVDPDLAHRRRAFGDVGRRLDGTGATVATLCDELQALIERAGEPLAQRQAAELAALDDRQANGARGGGRKAIDERHKRELRRHRIDELRSGLAVMAGAYRDALVAGTSHRPDSLVAAVERIHDAIEALERNPNETLLLQALLMELPSLS